MTEEYCKCGEHCKCGDKLYGHHHEEHYHHEENHHEEKLLKLADEAWMELLKEKIKAEIESKKGDQLRELAKIIALANKEKWHHKMAAKITCKEFKESLKEFFKSKEE